MTSFERSNSTGSWITAEVRAPGGFPPFDPSQSETVTVPVTNGKIANWQEYVSVKYIPAADTVFKTEGGTLYQRQIETGNASILIVASVARGDETSGFPEAFFDLTRTVDLDALTDPAKSLTFDPTMGDAFEVTVDFGVAATPRHLLWLETDQPLSEGLTLHTSTDTLVIQQSQGAFINAPPTCPDACNVTAWLTAEPGFAERNSGVTLSFVDTSAPNAVVTIVPIDALPPEASQ